MMAAMVYSATPAFGESLLLKRMPAEIIFCKGGASAPARHDWTHLIVAESVMASVNSKNSETVIPFEVPANSKSIGIQAISGL